jgi:predicted DNA-binding protein
MAIAKSQVATTRLPLEVAQRVRRLAHVRSLETGRDITASSLIRIAVEKFLESVETRS